LAIEVNRPCLRGDADSERHGADKNENSFLHVGVYVFCSGSRVGGGDLGKCRRHACRYSGRLRPESFGDLLGEKWRSVSEKAPL
jgi:hypothetical protein